VKLGIRLKFIGTLLIAAILPLCVAILAIQLLGYRHYRKAQGMLFQTRAEHLAQTLAMSVDKKVEKVDDWLRYSRIHRLLAEQAALLPAWDGVEFQRRLPELEARWRGLTPADAELQAILNNPLALNLKTFQVLNPLFIELLVTDDRGRLVAATGKTSDYWQADELWWQTAFQIGTEKAYVDAINYDESAGVYSIDLAVPVRHPESPERPPLGVLKAVLNASPLFLGVARNLAQEQSRWQLVLPDGRVLFGPGMLLEREQISPEAVRYLMQNQPGWMIASLGPDGPDVVGYAPLPWHSPFPDESVAEADAHLYVIVHDQAAVVLAPVRTQFWIIGVAGFGIVLASVLAGVFIANRKIIAPIETLRAAAQMVAASAKLQELPGEERFQADVALTAEAASVLRMAEQIRTRDEIEDLARDFGSMARRIFTYHEKLETEIAAKTVEIEHDLGIAREFQQALMPRTYPQVPSPGVGDGLTLQFHHHYQPASSVGGDFFDVLKLGDHQAGVFVADVMGHGARSALVTAILRTLLQDLCQRAADPAQFLSLVNSQFHEILRQSGQFVFASACYLTLDTQQAIATCASAGHPSPLVTNRDSRRVEPLIHQLANNPALGLFPNSVYANVTTPIKPGDLFLLFTDGISEAAGAGSEEFGRERLRRVIEDNLERDVPGLIQAIMASVSQFTNLEPLADDICMVAVEVNAAARPAKPAGPAVAKAAAKTP
jgi:sigma-B regulation protein RsbU (phosphoserine phosphatase)